MKKNISITGIVIIALTFIMVCCSRNERIISYKLTPDSVITKLSDSIYLSDQVLCLDYAQNHLYVSDYNNGIYSIDCNGNNVNHLVKKGRGHGEVGACGHFYAKVDGEICLYDESEKSFNFYRNDKLLKMIKVDQGFVLSDATRFFSIGDSVFHSITHNENTMIIIGPEQSSKLGRFVDGLDDIRKPVISERHVLKTENSILLVGLGLPIVEEYDYNGKKICSLNLMDIPRLKATYEKTQSNDPKSYFVVVEDAYYNHQKLYLLTSSNENDTYNCNTLYVIAKKNGKFEIECSYKLSGKVYSAICITKDNKCFAFNSIDTSLEFYTLPTKQ